MLALNDNNPQAIHNHMTNLLNSGLSDSGSEVWVSGTEEREIECLMILVIPGRLRIEYVRLE